MNHAYRNAEYRCRLRREDASLGYEYERVVDIAGGGGGTDVVSGQKLRAFSAVTTGHPQCRAFSKIKIIV